MIIITFYQVSYNKYDDNEKLILVYIKQIPIYFYKLVN